MQRIVCFVLMGLLLVLNVAVFTGLGLLYSRLNQDEAFSKCSICNESASAPRAGCCSADQIEKAQYLEKLIEEKISERLENWKSVKWKYVEVDNMTAVIPLTKPAAHLTISSTLKHHYSDQEGLNILGAWDTFSDNAFIGNGVNLWNGCIVVPLNGLYFVYSQVHFMKAADSTAGETILLHKINKRSKTQETSIFQPLVTQNDSLTDPGPAAMTEKSSYISVTVQLHVADHVCVLVNNIALVQLNSAATYFGLFLI